MDVNVDLLHVEQELIQAFYYEDFCFQIDQNDVRHIFGSKLDGHHDFKLCQLFEDGRLALFLLGKPYGLDDWYIIFEIDRKSYYDLKRRGKESGRTATIQQRKRAYAF